MCLAEFINEVCAQYRCYCIYKICVLLSRKV